ncbi:MAG: hypothetical protein F8N37_16550 [Telmatospirillum sp.]|nr:hypothetical protein [Telmatospirillum sp.]
MNTAVSPQDLQDLIDRYGEDLTLWPMSHRIPAQELIDECQEARDIIEQARALRRALRGMGDRAPDCFSDRIVALALELDPPAEDIVWLWKKAN